jgi:hypothetical protein
MTTFHNMFNLFWGGNIMHVEKLYQWRGQFETKIGAWTRDSYHPKSFSLQGYKQLEDLFWWFDYDILKDSILILRCISCINGGYWDAFNIKTFFLSICSKK